MSNIKAVLSTMSLEELQLPGAIAVSSSRPPVVTEKKLREAVALLRVGGTGDGIPVHMKVGLTQQQVEEIRGEMQARIAELTAVDEPDKGRE